MAAIEARIRKEYGRTRIYPTNDAARTLADIAGTKTLHPVDLQRARTLGLEVVLTYDEDCVALASLVFAE